MTQGSSKQIRVLHLTTDIGASVRLQRYLQSNLDMGYLPTVLCTHAPQPKNKNAIGRYTFWIPGFDRISINNYAPIPLMYTLNRMCIRPAFIDEIGLKETFRKYNCDLVHAHTPESAYYSYRLGLPTIFDDWEYWLEYFGYFKPVLIDSAKTRINHQMQHLFRGKQAGMFVNYSPIFYYLLKKRYEKIVLELIQNVPVIVTNKEVEKRYRELGASSIWSVPNVPLAFERNYAFAVDKEKRKKTTTCYCGDISSDEEIYLRNTRGVKELWQERNLGDLYVFEGKNFVSHLEVLRKMREFHFNLLFWKPLGIHRYYLQNKAFLASVVGIPTIISSSLKATIDLLGDYALPVNSLEEIPQMIETYNASKEYSLNPAHLWEYYEPQIEAAYEHAIDYYQ